MIRTQEALGNLVNYEAITKISPLEPPTVKKEDIPQFILCQNYDKAMQKVERTMERYRSKVSDLRARVNETESEILAINKRQEAISFEVGGVGGKRTPYQSSITEWNDLIDRRRRARERCDDAAERHNDAVRERDEKLEELTLDALAVIDEDIVAVLDKSVQTATKLSESENSEDIVAALEVSFIGLKIFNSFEEHIEGNVPRRDARERVTEINNLFSELSANEEASNYLADLFRRNAYLIEKNAELYGQVVEVIEGVDQEELTSMTQPFQQVFEKKFNTDFKYEGIKNPSTLDGVVAEMHKTIDALKANIDKVKELDASTQAVAEEGVNAHQNAEPLLATMKTNVEEMRDDLLFKEHFACDMIDEAVIEDFYDRDLRPAVTTLREHLVDLIGEEQIDALIMEDEDRYSIEKTEAAIKQADLLRLQAQRDRVAGYVNELSTKIKDVEAHIQKAGEVPRKNADEFKSSASSLYAMSCFPVLGFAFAMGIQGKIKEFAPAFKSTIDDYRKLGTEILAKNKTMQTVSLILAGVLGIGGIIVFLALDITKEVAANAGIPGAVLVFYLITWAILGSAGKKLQSYMGVSNTAQRPTTAGGTD